MASLAVAANLLICGEYAILEEGGLGIAAAVEPYVLARFGAADELTVASRWGNESTSWSPGASARPAARPERLDVSGPVRSPLAPPTLIDAVYEASREWLGAHSLGGPRGLHGRIDVDSSAFYGASGAKLGLGSSAAAAVALAASFLRLGAPERTVSEEELFRVALAGHRAFQGGSGYDVAASSYGGVGLFVGGARPSYRRIEARWLKAFRIVHANSAVQTPGAVARYRSWKEAHETEARDFLARSNAIVHALAEAATWNDARSSLLAAKELGCWLGAQIGVSAEVDELVHGLGGLPSGSGSPREGGSSARAQERAKRGAAPSVLAKALGAGNELAAVWVDEENGAIASSGASASDGAPGSVEASGSSGWVRIAERGVTWSE